MGWHAPSVLASQAGPANCGLYRYYLQNNRATLKQRFDAITFVPIEGGGVHPSGNRYPSKLLKSSCFLATIFLIDFILEDF